MFKEIVVCSYQEYYSLMEKKQLFRLTTTWMNLKEITLDKINPYQNIMHCMILFKLHFFKFTKLPKNHHCEKNLTEGTMISLCKKDICR